MDQPITHRSFDRTARLLGDAALARLRVSTVTVFGVGGVGSFAVLGMTAAACAVHLLTSWQRVTG